MTAALLVWRGAGSGDDGRTVIAVEKSAKTLTACTLVGLVVATGYTVALGSSGWLWFAWVVLGLVTVGVLTTKG